MNEHAHQYRRARGMARPLGRRNLLMRSAATLALAGCADVNYLAPTADVAGKFDAAAPGRDISPEARMWWRAFRDPQLDQLDRGGNARNLDAAQAIAARSTRRRPPSPVNGNDLPQVQASAGAQRALSSDAAASGGQSPPRPTSRRASLAAGYLRCEPQRPQGGRGAARCRLSVGGRGAADDRKLDRDGLYQPALLQALSR